MILSRDGQSTDSHHRLGPATRTSESYGRTDGRTDGELPSPEQTTLPYVTRGKRRRWILDGLAVQ